MTRWREWVTGSMPSSAETLTSVLPVPLRHDQPGIPRVYLGTLCLVQRCRKQHPTATSSLRYSPSGLCVACLKRLRGGEGLSGEVAEHTQEEAG
jgi:hypothetical protein